MIDALILTYKRASRDARIKRLGDKISKITKKRASLRDEALKLQKKYEEILREG